MPGDVIAARHLEAVAQPRRRIPAAIWLPSLLIIAFFLPYLPGTSFRVDQFLAWAAMGAIPLLFFFRRRREEWELLWLALGILGWVGLRVAGAPGESYTNLQIVNQYSYFLGALSLYLLLKGRLDAKIFKVVLWASIPIHSLGVYQSFFPNSTLVNFFLEIYTNLSFQDIGAGTYASVPHLLVKAARRSVSIFTGMHTLGAFSLLTAAVCLGSIRGREGGRSMPVLPIAALLFSVAGGISSNSKTYILGACVFAAIFIILTRKRLVSGILAGMVVLFAVAAFQVISEDKPTFEVFSEAFSTFKVFDLAIQGRFSQQGALVDKWEIVWQPATLLAGLGGQVIEHFYADCEYRQVILVGGLPLLILFYGFLFRVAALNYYSRRSNPFAVPFLALQGSWFLIAIGIAIHCQGRVTPLWLLLNLVALEEI